VTRRARSTLWTAVQRVRTLERFVARSTWGAAIAYTGATLALTWPLVRGLGRDIPSDLGDPLLNTWILAWVADHLARLASGDLGALRTFWHANIFYPEPFALAYSEALIPQAIQVLPVYALTRNPILCYNLLFLSTFVLSALGTYLLVRHLTGDGRAAFLAGLLYGFAPYRVSHFPHLQVLSSQWMPFVLYGFRRYLDTGGWRALVVAGLALWTQNLSCGYYLFFFAPILGTYLLYEILDRGRWRDAWTLGPIAGTLAVAYGATAVWLGPYLTLASRGVRRTLAEIAYYSADVYGYLTAHDAVRFWGSRLQLAPGPEGELFPGAVPVLLAGLAVGLWARRTFRHAVVCTREAPPRPVWLRWLSGLAFGAVLVYAVAIAFLLLHGRAVIYIGGVRLLVTNLPNLAQDAAVALAVLFAVSPRARAFVRGTPGSSVGIFITLAVMAWFFSLGPRVDTLGHSVGAGPYRLLLAVVPGLSALRVPARFAMLVALCLAVLSGLGLAALARPRPRLAAAIALVAAPAFLLEGTAVPIRVNQGGYELGLRPPEPGPMRQGDRTPPVYRHVAALAPGTVLVEFPFGAYVYEFQYLFYSTVHWKPLVNGFSGFFPPSYLERRESLRLPALLEDPTAAWAALRRSGATHAIVHTRAFINDEADRIGAWLLAHGASLVGTFEYDRLYELPRAP